MKVTLKLKMHITTNPANTNATGPQIGARTNHHDQSILSQSLSAINSIVRHPQNPMPPVV